MPPVVVLIAMNSEPSNFVSTQKFIGMQVIDSRGALVGNVKDISVDFKNKVLAFHLSNPKSRWETDIAWDDVLSVEDVVLLKKEVNVPAAGPSIQAAPPPTIQAQMICPRCGTSSPGHAKFCPKDGTPFR